MWQMMPSSCDKRCGGMVTKPSNDTTDDPPVDLNIQWARKGTWGRLLAFAVLFSIYVAGVPALVAILAERIWAVDGEALKYTVLILSVLLMPGFLIALGRPDFRKEVPDASTFFQRLSNRDFFALLGWMILTSFSASATAAALERRLMPEFDLIRISLIMAPLLFILCVRLFGSRLITSQRADGQSDPVPNIRPDGDR